MTERAPSHLWFKVSLRSSDLEVARFGSRWTEGSTYLPCLLKLDFHVDAGSQVELHQRVNGLRGRVYDVEKALVGAHFELFTALLVDVRRAVDRKLSMRVGSGTGPRTLAPVRFAVDTISRVEASRIR